jgi:hypothetical protein
MNILPIGNDKCKRFDYPEDSYLWVKIGNNQWMDKYEIRRQRLEQLIRDRAAGSQAKFAGMIDRSSSYVSRMLFEEGKAGKKRIADDMIEHIENALGLGRGWFDQTITGASEPTAWPFKSISYEEVAALSDVDLARLETAIILSADKVGIRLGNKSSKDSAAA